MASGPAATGRVVGYGSFCRTGFRNRLGTVRWPFYGSSHIGAVHRLSDSLFEFPEPGARVGTVRHAAEEPQAFGDAVAVLADVILRCRRVDPDELVDLVGLGKEVGGVCDLRDFDNDGALEVLSRESGICARFFCEAAVDVADDGRVWGFGG